MTTDIENIPKGIVWMLCTMFLFVTMDTVAKHLMQSFPVLQVVWARFFFHLLTMTLVLACLKRTAMLATLKSGNMKLQIFRSSLLVLTTGLFFTGLSHASLATASTMMFLSPIYVTVLSIPVLGERVGLRRWMGVLAGFIGALIIIRPGGESFTTGHFLLMIAPLTNAFYQLMTRKTRIYDNDQTTLLYTALVGVLLTSLGLLLMPDRVPSVWLPPEISAWLLLGLMGFLGCTSHLCLIKAFRSAPAAAVVPLSYSALIWATLYGYVLFNDLPDRWTLIGAAIIITSGIYIFMREQQIARSGNTH